MDSSNQAFAKTLQNTFQPIVVLITSPYVQKAFSGSGGENNNSSSSRIASFASECSRLQFQGPLKIKSTTNMIDTKSFAYRFLDLADYKKFLQSDSSLHSHLSSVSNSAASENVYGNFILNHKEDVPAMIKHLRGQDPTPWYLQYRSEFLKTGTITEFEYYSHPIACILATSTDDPNPVETLYSLFNNHKNIPAPFDSGVIDLSSFEKFYVVLNNQNSNSTKSPSTILQEMKSTFDRSRCWVVNVNGSDDRSASHSPFSVKDAESVTVFLKELSIKHIIPSIERAIQQMNEQVETTRKGLKNQVNRWLVGFGLATKKKEDVQRKNPNLFYDHSSIEAIQKRLGDLLFLIQDYQTAQDVYKIAINDYSNDKAWTHYASAHEMAGLSQFLLDPLKKDAENHIEKALTYYSSENLSRHLLRLSLFYAEMFRAKKQYQDAAHRFIMTGEFRLYAKDFLGAALFYEQAAFCYLFAPRTLLRKFALQLIMAGTYFSHTNQHKHTMRVYSAVANIYNGLSWNFIDTHIYFTLARLSYVLNRREEAMMYIYKLMEKTNKDQLAHTQDGYMKEFLKIFENFYTTLDQKPTRDHPIFSFPVVMADTVTIFLRDYPPKSPQQTEWKNLEKELKNEGKPKKPPTLWKPFKKKTVLPKLAVVGEPIFLEVDLVNPLQILIDLAEVKLIATYEENNQPHKISHNFQMEPIDLTFTPGERKKTRFTFTPLIPGTCTIEGIAFKLFGKASGRVKLDAPKKRLNNTQEERRGIFYEDSQDLRLRITKDMPLLEIAFPAFPELLVLGQLHEITLELKNTGQSPLQKLKVNLTPAAFFVFDPPSPEQLEKKWNGLSEEYSPSIYHVDLKEDLQPGQSVTVHLWVRGCRPGSHECQFLFYYEPTDLNSAMKYRLQRTTRTLKVSNTIKITHSLMPSSASVQDYLLNVELTNSESTNNIAVRKILPISSIWKLQNLGQSEKIEDLICPPSRSINLFFKVTPSEQKALGEPIELSPQRVSLPLCAHYGHLFQDKTCSTHARVLQLEEKARMSLGTFNNMNNNNNNNNNWNLSDNNNNNEKEEMPSKKLDSKLLDMIFVWEMYDPANEAQQGALVGQHHFTQVMQHNSKVEKSSFIRLVLHSNTHISHNFSNNPTCKVTVQFHLFNTSPAFEYTVSLLTLKPHEPIDPAQTTYSAKRAHYFWSGKSSHQHIKLAPNSKVIVESDVCFVSPGTYNVNRYRLLLHESDSTEPLLMPTAKLQHVIVVESPPQVDKNDDNNNNSFALNSNNNLRLDWNTLNSSFNSFYNIQEI